MGPKQKQEFAESAQDKNKNESNAESFKAVQETAAARRKQTEEVDKLLSEDSEAWLRSMKQHPGE